MASRYSKKAIRESIEYLRNSERDIGVDEKLKLYSLKELSLIYKELGGEISQLYGKAELREKIMKSLKSEG